MQSAWDGADLGLVPVDGTFAFGENRARELLEDLEDHKRVHARGCAR